MIPTDLYRAVVSLQLYFGDGIGMSMVRVRLLEEVAHMRHVIQPIASCDETNCST